MTKEFGIRKANVAILVLGGIDSSVTAVLAKRTLILPDSNVTPEHDITDALNLVKRIKINYEVIEVKDIRKDLF